MSLCVIVVTYNSAGVIERCLRSCGGLNVIVVDNASTDGTAGIVRKFAEEHAGVRMIANDDNRGFAGAVNQAVNECAAEFLLLLNPDAELSAPPWALIEACERVGADLATAKLTGGDGRAQAGFQIRRFPTAAALTFETLGINRIFPNNRINAAYRCLNRDPEAAGEVEQPAGAFLLFRRKLWERLGGFDERFHPIWFEDVDFCKRASDMGAKIYYFPMAGAKHLGGHSVISIGWEWRELHWCDSLLKYASKHFRPFERRVVGLAVAAGSLFRTLITICRRRSLKPFAVYRQVLRLAARCVFAGAGGGKGSDANGAEKLDEFKQPEIGNKKRLHVQ